MPELTIIALLAPNPSPMTLEGTNTYVVGDAAGCLVIDPGCDDGGHLAAIQDAGARLGGIQHILVTHAHPDHIGGARELSALLSAPVLAVSQGDDDVPFAARTITDGEALAAGGQTLTVLLTPGHRSDHCCLWHAPTRQLFAGDLMAGRGTVVIAPPQGDMRAYLASLQRVRELAPQRIWPGHGPVIADPHQRIDDYLAHRLDREKLVIDALQMADTPQRLAELVPVVYRDTPPALHPVATFSLLAHLLKLEAEGRARPTDAERQTWRLA